MMASYICPPILVRIPDGSGVTVDVETGLGVLVPVPAGPPGRTGDPGADGVSPTISVTDITGGHRVSITDKHGTNIFDVMDGEDGDPGTPGADGVSPAVSIASITGGHSVTITDKDHPGGQTFSVMDGEDGDTGPAGPGLPAGGSAGQSPVKASGTDYVTEWKLISPIHFTVSVTSLPCTVSDARITAAMRVIEAVLGTPSAVTTDLTWTTAAGSVVFSGTLASGGSTTLDFDLIEVVT